MKIFVDECIDWRLAREIIGHEVSTPHEVFLTVDRNLAFQQNVPALDIAIVVRRCRSNRLLELRRLIPDLLARLPAVKPGTLTYIGV